MKRFLAAVALAGLAFSALALPTVDEVQAEVAKGNYTHAEQMMREVVADKPGSARAHYIYAEILAHDKRFDLAAEQAARAKSIDPGLKFTQPEKFRAFEQLLEREQAAARRPAVTERAAVPAFREPAALPVERSSGVPGWVWGLGLAAVAFVAWRVLSTRRQAAPAPGYLPAPGAGTPMAAGGYGPSYGPGSMPGPAGSAGSGLLGTGLAVAGGVAAGMLAEKLLSDRQSGPTNPLFPDTARGLDGGLLDARPADDPAARELEERPVDFGNGDGWSDGDAGGGGGSSDGGWD